MSDIRVSTIASIQSEVSSLAGDLLSLQSVANDLSLVIKTLQGNITAIQADLAANPTPASPAVTTGPTFVPVPFNSTALHDYFGMYGAGATIIYSGNGVDYQPPAGPSKTANGTSSVLLNTPNFTAQNFKCKLTMVTEKQLRTSGAPNAWECGWLLFNFHTGSDGKPAYNYVAFKPNGVEIGTGFSGIGQTFLYTSSLVTFPIGAQFVTEIDKQGTTFNLSVNGKSIFTGLSFSGAYDVPGQFALYCEDSEVLVSDFEVMVLS